MTPVLELFIPLITVSEFNCSDGWKKRAARHKRQRLLMGDVLKDIPERPKLPVRVLLVRCSPRSLDDDNLRGALKCVRDTVAAWLRPGLRPGFADNGPEIAWDYGQEQGRRGVRIVITEVNNDAFFG